MAQLTFTGRSRDGKRLLLVDPSGQEHTLVIDARLRRALAGASESNGQLEIPMESTLRPRDIQARIRAGETPEAVAHAAGTSGSTRVRSTSSPSARTSVTASSVGRPPSCVARTRNHDVAPSGRDNTTGSPAGARTARELPASVSTTIVGSSSEPVSPVTTVTCWISAGRSRATCRPTSPPVRTAPRSST